MATVWNGGEIVSIWAILLLGELAAGWIGYWAGFSRGQETMENKRGRRTY